MSSAAPGTPSGYARQRGVSEVLHFTTNHGLIGILETQAILSRDKLEASGRLREIQLLNCISRSKDPEWTDYVNLSITDVNQRMLNSSRGWHPPQDGVWWAVLAFDTSILDADGVQFTTTNNSYRATVRRGESTAGLADLFSEPISWGYYGAVKTRYGRAANQPTCDQAEVLYPQMLPLGALQAIYVPDGEHIDEVEGWYGAFPTAPHVPVSQNPQVFR